MRQLRIVIISFTLMWVTKSHCQNSSQSIELAFGPSISYLFNSSSYDQIKLNPTITTSYAFLLSNESSIKAGLSYEQKGGRDSHDSFVLPDGTVCRNSSTSLRKNYVTIPFLYMKYLGAEKGIFIETGPYIAYLLSVSYRQYSCVNDRYNVYRDPNNKGGYRTLDFGVAIGVGFSKAISEKYSLVCATRYQQGILDLSGSLSLLVGIRYDFD